MVYCEKKLDVVMLIKIVMMVDVGGNAVLAV